jgi:hypothetical protein
MKFRSPRATVRILATLILGGSLAACAGAPRTRPIRGGPVDTGSGTLTAARAYLEGRWVLESFEVMPPGGQPIRLVGTGTLVYDNFGNLTIDIQADAASADILRQAGIELQGGHIVSTGRTVVDMSNRTLTYVIEGQPPVGAPSGPLAMNRPRHWQVEGTLLTLTTQDEQGTPLSVGRWRKQ